MTRRICVVTGSRAEYGLLRWLMEGIRQSPDLELQVVVTGMHIAPEFGQTYREIEADGFVIHERVEMLLSSDTAVGTAKSVGLGVIGFADVLQRLRPDIMVVLGDRFEILAAVCSALTARVPVAHLHGGEITAGAFDDAIRHAITKMSHLHFVAAEEYRSRVIQLGESPDRVFLVGGLGLDNMDRLELLARDELEQALEFQFGSRNLLVTYHPVTLDGAASIQHMAELLAALDAMPDVHIVFTMPNADTDGRALAAMVREFVAGHPRSRYYTSLGQRRYLSCMQLVDGVVGNSSSGLIEAPALLKGTVNVGDRQKGRLRAGSVIDCEPDRQSISAALSKLYSAEFRASLGAVENPYGTSGASDKILKILRSQNLDGLTKKMFHDLPTPPHPQETT